jgi:glycosyltransferase involved in cell wall biosynthesis
MDRCIRGRSTARADTTTLLMTLPLVSVVIETITARFDGAREPLADSLSGALAALDRQTYPQELIERIIVLDDKVAAAETVELRRRYPAVKFLSSSASNYFAAKNAGTAAAAGEVVALLDGDCVPEPDWVEALLGPFESGVAAVAGRTRYEGSSWFEWTFSIPDFAYILTEENGTASGFNLNNVMFRRDVLLAHPFDTRIRRDGGCYLLFHQLRADGARVLHEPSAIVTHRLDFRVLGFVRKHFDRGYDGAEVYRLDDRAVLRGTRLFRRLGALALVAITGRRIVVDWRRLLRHRGQIGIPVVALPYFGTVAVGTRLIELIGGLMAIVSSRTLRQET